MNTNIYWWFNTQRNAEKNVPPALLTPMILHVIDYKLTVRVSNRTRWIISERIINWQPSYSSFFLLNWHNAHPYWVANILPENFGPTVKYTIKRTNDNSVLFGMFSSHIGMLTMSLELMRPQKSTIWITDT